MRIEAVELHRIQIPMKRAFVHALHERKGSDAVLVAIVDEVGTRGWGEIVPRPYVTGETIEDVLARDGSALARDLVGRTFGAMDEVAAWLRHAADRASRRLATVCGFDLAVLDVAGQRMAQPLAAVLGGVRFEPLPAGVIIGFETPVEKLARYCASLRLAGKTHVKVKVGLPDDLERLAEVGRVFKALPLRLDANAAWSADEAVTRLRAMQDVVAIASIEQPVPKGDLVGLRRIRQETGIAVMADESVCSLADAQRLAEAEAADIFNIRLGKNGGSLASARLVEAARDAQICVHLGTMVGETGILGRASEVFGRCVPGFTCLDGKGQSAFLLEVDIVEEFGDHSSNVEAPGLGVRVSAERLKTYTVGEPRRFS